MKRYNSTERIGIHKVGAFFEESFNWIFREQSVSDVGVDAIQEKCTYGNPTGKFLALQIKSGEGNFYKSKNGYTYYISDVHYYYWLNLDLPVLLLGYIPNTDSIYWQEISNTTVSKARNQWKVELLFEKRLTKDSLLDFEELISRRNHHALNPIKSKQRQLQSGRDKYLLMSNSLDLIGHYQKVLVSELNEEKGKISTYKAKYSKDKKRCATLKSTQRSILENFANRMLLEIKLFAEMNAEFVISTDSYIESKWDQPLFQNIEWKKGKQQAGVLIETFQSASESMNNILEGLKSYRKRDIFKNSDSIRIAENSIKKIKVEFLNASALWKELREKWNRDSSEGT